MTIRYILIGSASAAREWAIANEIRRSDVYLVTRHEQLFGLDIRDLPDVQTVFLHDAEYTTDLWRIRQQLSIIGITA